MRGKMMLLGAVLTISLTGSAWAAGPRGAIRYAPAPRIQQAVRWHDARARQVQRAAARRAAALQSAYAYQPAIVATPDASCIDEAANCPQPSPAYGSCPPAALAPVFPNQARDAMDDVQTRLTADMQASPQWNQTFTATQQAVSDLESARQRIEAALSQRSDYQAALAQRQAAQEVVDQMHAGGNETPEEMTPLAQRRLDAAKAITQMQVQALQADPQWVAAHNQLLATAAGRVAMQNQLRADLVNDPLWRAARQQLG